MAFYTYLLTNTRNGTLYCGHTEHLGLRVEHHRDAVHGETFTSRHGLKHLVWFEAHDTRDAAFRRERRIKKWERAWKLRLIEAMNPFWLSITDCPVWPIPLASNDLMATLRARCLAQSLDPRLRGDERYEERCGRLLEGWETRSGEYR